MAWETIEQNGGVLPEVEEDRSQAPPAWWRYPSAMRSAALLAAEAASPQGLYETVPAGGLQKGDILVRTQGAGVCGKMAVLGPTSEGRWQTVEAEGASSRAVVGSPVFFQPDGKTLRSEVKAYRIRVKKEETLGHVRELRRDLEHLERTIGERPPLIAKNARAAVDDKVHELVDEAWSLIADTSFDLERRELTARALVLGAALDWPGAAPLASAMVEDVLRRAPGRPEALAARARLLLLSAQPGSAVPAARDAVAAPGARPRARYVLGRALIASGDPASGLADLKRYLEADPRDPRAARLVRTNGAQPALAAGPPVDSGIRYVGAPEEGGADIPGADLRLRWPVTWRVVAATAAPGATLLTISTGRVLLDNGEAQRGSVSLLAERAPNAAERGAMARKAARNLFPNAALKTLPPLVAGSRREHFVDRKQHAQGEVTTIERGDTVYMLVLNAPAQAYKKVKDEYAAFVKSAGPLGAPPPGASLPVGGSK